MNLRHQCHEARARAHAKTVKPKVSKHAAERRRKEGSDLNEKKAAKAQARRKVNALGLARAAVGVELEFKFIRPWNGKPRELEGRGGESDGAPKLSLSVRRHRTRRGYNEEVLALDASEPPAAGPSHAVENIPGWSFSLKFMLELRAREEGRQRGNRHEPTSKGCFKNLNLLRWVQVQVVKDVGKMSNDLQRPESAWRLETAWVHLKAAQPRLRSPHKPFRGR
ncbi:hypothetical protein C8R45DRAFT_933049 [Mycena sanguinolenta]|nr:hypothetical protein C8R45DRAFT_933049 [Mycena sanguinolenta]